MNTHLGRLAGLLGLIAVIVALESPVHAGPPANTVVLTQVNAGGTGNNEVDVLGTSGGILTFNASLVPIPGVLVGTANQVTVGNVPSTGVFTISLPSVLVAPGSFQVTGSVAIGRAVAASRALIVAGQDATSSNYALSVQNNVAGNLFDVRDDGLITVYNSTTIFTVQGAQTIGGALGVTGTSTMTGHVGIGAASTSTSPLHISGLPTSAAGLATGDVWNNSGVLTIH